MPRAEGGGREGTQSFAHLRGLASCTAELQEHRPRVVPATRLGTSSLMEPDLSRRVLIDRGSSSRTQDRKGATHPLHSSVQRCEPDPSSDLPTGELAAPFKKVRGSDA